MYFAGSNNCIPAAIYDLEFWRVNVQHPCWFNYNMCVITCCYVNKIMCGVCCCCCKSATTHTHTLCFDHFSWVRKLLCRIHVHYNRSVIHAAIANNDLSYIWYSLYEAFALVFSCISARYHLHWVPGRNGEGAFLSPAGQGVALVGRESRQTEGEGTGERGQTEEREGGDRQWHTAWVSGRKREKRGFNYKFFFTLTAGLLAK